MGCRAWLAILALLGGTAASEEVPDVSDKQAIIIDFCTLLGNTSILDFLGDNVGELNFIDINGTVTIEGEIPSVTGNGIPDLSNEFKLLQTILADPQFDNGVLTHAQVRQAWTDNLSRMRSQQLGGILAGILDSQLPGFVELLTAYVTLGDGTFTRTNANFASGTGSFGLVAGVFDQFDRILEELSGLPGGLLLRDSTPNKADYTTLIDLAGTTQSDGDGDGLSNRDEFNFFVTNNCNGSAEGILYAEAALTTDADGDGMSDGWEAQYVVTKGSGLDPAFPDALEDPDGDLLPNIEEFLGDSDPLDLDDPEVTRFVSGSGDNQPFPNAGGPDNPWSIDFGISQTPDVPGDKPVRLNLDPGEYTGDITMKPGMIISGINRFDGKGTGEAVIVGTITGAEGARLEFLTVQAPTDDAILLIMDDVSMHISGVTFRGTSARLATGIFTSGLAPGSSLVDGSLFTQLAIGMDIGDGIPKLRRSAFENHSISQIVVRNSILTGAGSEGLGDSKDPEVGFNLFRDPTATAIINERPATLRVEENDWDTNDSAEIEARVQGNIDFEPFLLKGQAVLAATLFCTVIDADTQVPIEDAEVRLVPSAYNAVTANEEGVYAFAAIAAGGYTVEISADGYVTRDILVNLEGGLKSITVAMSVPLSVPDPGGACCASGNKSAPGHGDLLVGLLTIVAMAGFALLSSRP